MLYSIGVARVVQAVATREDDPILVKISMINISYTEASLYIRLRADE